MFAAGVLEGGALCRRSARRAAGGVKNAPAAGHAPALAYATPYAQTHMSEGYETRQRFETRSAAGTNTALPCAIVRGEGVAAHFGGGRGDKKLKVWPHPPSSWGRRGPLVRVLVSRSGKRGYMRYTKTRCSEA